MEVFKFGGASVNSVERIKNLRTILLQDNSENKLIVISAMGKTTNALEKVTDAFFNNKTKEALQLFEQIKNQHLTTAKYLLVTNYLACEEQLQHFFTEVEWLLHDKPQKDFDYYYDQIVCIGELLSTSIISHYLNETFVKNTWVDVRDIIRTDANFRDATIDWDFTKQQISAFVVPLFDIHNIVITQGYIGATDENQCTTLGREGSDYTAAVFANLLDAKSLTIWKDVPAVMNADPKQFPDAQAISELNYTEVIEMAYYGAQVIHPKTIKPLQNKNIPLYVKCFTDSSLPGTCIHNKFIKKLPPIIVLKENQVMMELCSKDFSFVEEKPVATLFHLFESLKIKPNLMQNGAISIICILDDHSSKIEKLAAEAASIFEVKITKNLTLLTIRHYSNEIFEKLTYGKKILLLQKTPETVQALIC